MLPGSDYLPLHTLPFHNRGIQAQVLTYMEIDR